MSEIRVTTLKDTSGGNSSTTAQVFSGRAKVWVNFNGGGVVAIRSNFNVNTITDNGTGDYTLNFTTAMSNTNYCVTSFVRKDNSSIDAVICAVSLENSTKTTSAFAIRSFFRDSGAGMGSFDSPEIGVAIFS